MGQPGETQRSESRAGGWLRLALLALLAEKIIQHIVVTLAFASDAGGIRATVALPYQILMVTGAALAVCFALALWWLWRRDPWARGLTITLALIDIVGEFLAQGTLLITITISFLVACALLLLALLYRQRSRAPRAP
jgi:hypothetical protein